MDDVALKTADFFAILIPLHMKGHAARSTAGGETLTVRYYHNMKLTSSVETQMPTAVLDALLAVLHRPLSIHHQ